MVFQNWFCSCHIHTHVCICVYIYIACVRVYVCVCACVHVYIYIYIKEQFFSWLNWAHDPWTEISWAKLKQKSKFHIFKHSHLLRHSNKILSWNMFNICVGLRLLLTTVSCLKLHMVKVLNCRYCPHFITYLITY